MPVALAFRCLKIVDTAVVLTQNIGEIGAIGNFLRRTPKHFLRLGVDAKQYEENKDVWHVAKLIGFG